MKKTFTGHTRLFLSISGVIIVAALIMQICGVGLNLGIDFTGGSLLSYSVGEDYDVKDVETILASAGYEGSQITKAAPSDASVALQEELAQEAAEETAEEATEETTEEVTEEATEETTEEATEETIEETTEETAEEATEETTELLLDMDKSGIGQDGMTDLEIRLNLVDESEGLEDAIVQAVAGVLPEASEAEYRELTKSVIVNYSIDSDYSGGYMVDFTVGADFDKQAVIDAVQAALAENYSLDAVTAVRYDAEAEAAEETADTTEEATAATEEAADTTEEATETAEEVTETAEEVTETAEEVTETTEETAGAAEETEEAEETGDDLRVLVKIDDQASRVRELLETQMTAKYPNFRFVSIDHVSAVAGHDLLSNAVKALLIAFACMLIYIAIRFDFFSGVAALLALVHDVLIMCAFMVFFRSVYQVNSSFIAAILTIVGYSINNTIIIFDRIRENLKKPGATQIPQMDIVETSVSSTLSRTINTSLTTLITLVALYIFGVEAIREFAFPLIVGMLAGSYSSMLLSGQIWAMWVSRRAAKQAQKQAEKKPA